MSIPQFEGFRFSVDDKVIIKATDVEGRITQCRYEIVSNEKGEYIVEVSYLVNYGSYLQKSCKENKIKYKLDLNPESERRVLYEIMDVNLKEKKFDYVRDFNEARNKLNGDKK